ncbi:hypothetical protein GH714_027561 [Hevea brasiliensis]|uniref:TIR domain-containing protein n=1 Tax=Hevea brasiliensis TaxID=3981 RepID=A0A6A6NJJ6_HEVBR|nr:hypothetical protein GH714_027561 [Hevea brasiliensis]
MSQGDEIAPSLLDAIEDSAASIIMLSPNYANSHWCLEELATICQLGRLILPVFYDVDLLMLGNRRVILKKISVLILRVSPVHEVDAGITLIKQKLPERRLLAVLDDVDDGTRYVQGIILDFRRKHFVEEDPSAGMIFCSNFLAALNPNSILKKVITKIMIVCDNFLAYLKEKWARLPSLPRGEEKQGEIILSTSSFESMVNLRLLQINRVKLEGKFKYFPGELKWLQWKECPLRNLPSDYHPSRLAILDLSESGIQRVWGWGSNKVAEKLMVMNLRHCHNLVAIPDLYGYKTLEKLDLERCIRLTKIHKSVGNLKTLLCLNLKGCSNLIEMPSDVSGLKHLQNLILSGCSKLKELPEDIGSMKSLKELHVDRTAISKLPESIYRLTKLEKLNLDGCQFIKRLPKCLGNLISLKELLLDQTALEELPDSVGSLSNLETLSLRRCQSLSSLPESIGELQSLTEIFVGKSAITELPHSIGSLSYLKQLSAEGCESLSKLPDSIMGLSCISELQLDGTSITSLPDQIGYLRMIEKLYMRSVH